MSEILIIIIVEKNMYTFGIIRKHKTIVFSTKKKRCKL